MILDYRLFRECKSHLAEHCTIMFLISFLFQTIKTIKLLYFLADQILGVDISYPIATIKSNMVSSVVFFIFV